MFDKILRILGWITIIFIFIIMLLFVIILIKLYRYDKCKQLEFEPPYCEKYKNF